jgi:Reductase C-terminal
MERRFACLVGDLTADLLGRPAPSAQLPYVWSDQYGHRIQIAGRPGLGALAVRHGDVHHDLVAIYADAFMKIRKAIVKRQPAAAIELPVPASATI